jgi:hypothetical protein
LVKFNIIMYIRSLTGMYFHHTLIIAEYKITNPGYPILRYTGIVKLVCESDDICQKFIRSF